MSNDIDSLTRKCKSTDLNAYQYKRVHVTRFSYVVEQSYSRSLEQKQKQQPAPCEWVVNQ